jgi:hypothetical protein
MATAPKPGARKKAEAQRTALRITLKDKTYTLHMSDLGPRDDLEARKETGIAVMPFFHAERFASDAVLMVLWMARRKSGEPDLRYTQVLDEFPNWSDLEGVELAEVTDEEDDSPEG